MSLRGDERQEFPKSVRKLAFIRCCKNGTMPGIPQCEKCGIELRTGNIEYEHIIPDGLGGEPTLENCGVWCRSACSRQKTFTEDNPRMQKADRQLKKSFGISDSRSRIQSAGFRKSPKQCSATRPLTKQVSVRGATS